MKTDTVVPISNARARLFEIADAVQDSQVAYTLTERGRPKVVVLSARRFEKMTTRIEKKSVPFGVMTLSDTRGKYGGRATVDYAPMLLRESTCSAWLPRDNGVSDREAEYIRAILYVQMIEQYGFLPTSVEFGRHVRVGKEGRKHYIEADIIVYATSSRPFLVAAVAPFGSYERLRDVVVSDLFDIAQSVSDDLLPRYLVYYSRTFHVVPAQEKITVVDTKRYNTFFSWKRSGCPTSDTMPSQNDMILQCANE